MLISSPWQQKIRKRRLTQNLQSYHQHLPVKARFGFTRCSLQSYSIKQISCGFICGNRRGALICRGRMWTPFCGISFSVCPCQAKLQPEIHVSGTHESRLLRQVQPERGMARQLLWVHHPFPLSRFPVFKIDEWIRSCSKPKCQRCCFQPLKRKDVLLFSSITDTNWRLFGFWTFGWKRDSETFWALGKCHEHVFSNLCDISWKTNGWKITIIRRINQ